MRIVGMDVDPRQAMSEITRRMRRRRIEVDRIALDWPCSECRIDVALATSIEAVGSECEEGRSQLRC